MAPEEALNLLRQSDEMDTLKWYRVSNLVNNSRQKTADCNKPLRLIRWDKMARNPIMNAWLNARRRKEAELAKVLKSHGDDDDDDYEENEVVDNHARRCSLHSSLKRMNDGNQAKTVVNKQMKRPCLNNNR